MHLSTSVYVTLNLVFNFVTSCEVGFFAPPSLSKTTDRHCTLGVCAIDDIRHWRLICLLCAASGFVMNIIGDVAGNMILLTYGGLLKPSRHHDIAVTDVPSFQAITSIRLYAIDGRRWLFPCLTFILYLPTVIVSAVSELCSFTLSHS